VRISQTGFTISWVHAVMLHTCIQGMSSSILGWNYYGLGILCFTSVHLAKLVMVPQAASFSATITTTTTTNNNNLFNLRAELKN
jgi:hypothetical protein